MTLSKIFSRAIELAEDGFPVGPKTSYFWKAETHKLTTKHNVHGKDMMVRACAKSVNNDGGGIGTGRGGGG